MNMRLALTMLSQTYGVEDNYRVMNAQTEPNGDALVLRDGRADLARLRLLLSEAGLPHDGAGQRLRLRVPLVIWDGALLDLGPGDVLELSRPDGAFVMNFGHLRMQGGTIAAEGDPNAISRSFRPFVTTADSGTLAVRGATFTGLGFGETLKFTGFSVMRSLLRAPDAPAWIEGSLFQDLLTLAVSSDNGALISGNQFRDMRGAALVLERTRDAAVLSNLFSGAMPTNAIRLQDGSVFGLIAGNVVLGGERSGIFVRDGSHHAVIASNVVWHRDGGGISLAQSDCGRISGNLVLDNDQKGIEVRRSKDVAVTDNTILSNHSAGIWVSEQGNGSQTLLMGNLLAFNGAGLAAAGGERLVMQDNDFSGQYLQFLGGDIAAQTPHVARNMRGEVPMVLTAAGRFDAEADAAAATACAEG
jgi:poly(beta-D-mannuronate) C5 epimerase